MSTFTPAPPAYDPRTPLAGLSLASLLPYILLAVCFAYSLHGAYESGKREVLAARAAERRDCPADCPRCHPGRDAGSTGSTGSVGAARRPN